jgi:hypothetical protein
LIAALGAVSCSVGLVFAASLGAATGPNTDPFVNCSVGAGTGLSYARSEVEPYAAINPIDAANIITVQQQDRWDNGGARGLTASVTKNGGASWTVVALPFSRCAASAPADLQYERASDPWVSFGPGAPGNPAGVIAYSVSISFNQSAGKNGNTVGAAVSYDGGSTWVNAQSLHGDTVTGVPLPVPDGNFQFFHDKESVTADPTRPGTAYAVWDVLIGPNMSVEADLHAAAFTDFTLFSRTSDFGRTWSAARIINTNANGKNANKNQTLGNVIVVDPRTGVLYDVFDQIFSTGSNAGGTPNGRHGFNVAVQKSTDGGDSWSQPQLISPLLSVGVADPNNVDPRTNKAPAPLRTGDIIPAPAIDSRGILYVVWQDSRFSGFDEIVISASLDGGATWSLPKRVNSPTGQPAFTASVAVSSNGTIGVSYYQLSPTSLGSMPTRYLIKTFSLARLLNSASSSIDRDVSASIVGGPFNMLDVPFALGYFTGDYEALITSGTTFVPVFVQGTCGPSLSCRALTSVTPPANIAPTGNNSTDVFAGMGF